ncbi:unnamed protein product [Pipistrellus nathusii]|uniref:G-protein coupled receptors family 3 profile domain-containing protein n=1 Tax=Pipistrellus nathusii TaxID=59473 RepID=A0ABP0A3M3_PIPNA
MGARGAPALLLLCVAAAGATENASTTRGCGLGLLPQYVSLCDLDSVWGIVVEAAAGAGALITLLLLLILLVRLPFITEPEKREPLGLHFLFLLGTLGLFGLSFAFVIREGEAVCAARRFLWGVLFALCFACLAAQAWRVRALGRRGRGPPGPQLLGAALGLTLVQVVIAAEWLVLTVLRAARPACAYEPADFALALGYALALLAAALALALRALCGGAGRWRRRAAGLLLTAVLAALVWAAWLAMYLYGNARLRPSGAWRDPSQAVALVASGWVFVLCHAVPEVRCALLPAPRRPAPDLFAAPPRAREPAPEEDVPPCLDNKAFALEEPGAALRTAGFRNSSLGSRPSAPFRSNVYQPTEMAVVLNGGTIPTAPPSYTGRHLW